MRFNLDTIFGRGKSKPELAKEIVAETADVSLPDTLDEQFQALELQVQQRKQQHILGAELAKEKEDNLHEQESLIKNSSLRIEPRNADGTRDNLETKEHSDIGGVITGDVDGVSFYLERIRWGNHPNNSRYRAKVDGNEIRTSDEAQKLWFKYVNAACARTKAEKIAQAKITPK